MEEKNYNNNVTKSHKVLLANRGNGAFSGVVDVLSFDVAEISARDGTWDAAHQGTGSAREPTEPGKREKWILKDGLIP